MKKISLEKYFVGVSRDSLVYGLGSAVIRILALFTAPIFTRIFVPAEYGVISLIASIISFMSLFLIFGMDSAIFISFYEYKNQRKIIISSAFWFLFVWSLIIVIFSTISSGELSSIIFHNSNYHLLLIIAFWTAFLTLLVNLTKIVFRLEFKAKTFTIVSIVNALFSTGLMIFFVVYLKKGLVGYFEGSLIGTFTTLLFALYAIRRNLVFKINWRRLKEMIAFGAMVVPASLSFFVFDLSDRFFLNHYRNLAELGLYSIGINIASLIVFFSYAFGQAWSPQIMKMYFKSKRIYKQFVARFFVYYLIFFFGLAVLITLFSQEILRIFTTPKFYGAFKVIGPLTIAMVFASCNQVTALGMTISRKMKLLATWTILAAVLNISLNFLLIPQYGMVGAGWATAFSYLFLTSAYFYNSQKFIPLKIDWQKIIKLVILSTALIILAPLTWRFGFWHNFLLKCLESVAIFCLLYLVGVIEKQELQYIKISFKKIFQLKGTSHDY